MDTASIDLPEGVIEVILSKCPAKSVVRFKSVSKSWQSMISDPRFTRIHRIQRSKLPENQNKFLIWGRPKDNPTAGGVHVIQLKDGNFQRESFFPYQSRIFVFPLCCCNGLFLLTADPNNHRYLLWNPSIRKRIVIRGLRPKTDPHAFKAGASPHPNRHHMYYDSITDDHKIVFVYDDCYTVYSCRAGSWAGMKDLPCDISLIDRGASVDGCIYGILNGDIVCFDARDGNVHKFKQPNDVKCEVELGELSGRVCLFGLSGCKKKLHLWVMEKHGSFEKWCFSWRKLIGMEKEEADLWFLRPICLSNEDEVVLYAKVGQVKGLKYFVYNPRQNSFQKIEFNWKHSQPIPYSENLCVPSSNMLV